MEGRLSSEEAGDQMLHRAGDDLLIISYGRILEQALVAADELARRGIRAQVTELIRLYPLESREVRALTSRQRPILFVEEHVVSGSIGLHFLGLMHHPGAPWSHLCIRDSSIGHATLAEQWDMAGLSSQYIVNAALALAAAVHTGAGPAEQH